MAEAEKYCEFNCPAEPALSQLARDMARIIDKLDSQEEIFTEMRIQSETRAIYNKEVSKKLDSHMEASAKRAEEFREKHSAALVRIENIETTIEEREAIFHIAKRFGALISTGIGLVVIAGVAYFGIWVIKKCSGVDLTPLVHGKE